METKKFYCSSENHSEQKASKFCPECNLYMCNQCLNYHSKLFKNHHIINISENIENIFTGFCKEENHSSCKLDYFCKLHNLLCCSLCIEKNSNSKHTNCTICRIEEIKEEKKLNFENNIKTLENISNNMNESVDKIKNYYDKVQEIKENMKSKIMKVITNIRNKLNEREDEILKEIDTTFLKISPDEKLIKEYELIPKKISEILKNKELIEKKLEDKFLLN